MNGEELIGSIKEYLDNVKSTYALMIDGEWGSGKTYFFKHNVWDIVKSIDYGKAQRRKCSYVSLYGVKDISTVAKELFISCQGEKKGKIIRGADDFFDVTTKIFSLACGPVNVDLSKTKDLLSKFNIKDCIICFDDFERCCIPINEILGFINQLVEHNNCKVIILANEREVGKIGLNNNIENKYLVTLNSGTCIKEKNGESNFDIDLLNEKTKQIFSENLLYNSIKEKAIGLTIKYIPDMNEMFDSIIDNLKIAGKYKEYLLENKKEIIKRFSRNDCLNLRTLIIVIEILQKLFREMQIYASNEYYDKVMEQFLRYVVEFVIYVKNGGKVGKLGLKTSIGYVSLGTDIFNSVRAFKFLEKYCISLSFSEEEFKNTVHTLLEEFKAFDEKQKRSKYDLGKAYGELSYWWECEDEVVRENIKLMYQEISEDKYPIQVYPNIIAQLIVLEKQGFGFDKWNDLIKNMNNNIDNEEECIAIEKHGHTFTDDIESQNKYDLYVNRLREKTRDRQKLSKSEEINSYFDSDSWADDLLEYCEKNFNEFLQGFSFLTIIDEERFYEKLNDASIKSLYRVKDILKKTYGFGNINEFFKSDEEKIKKLKDKIEKMETSGINRTRARDELVKYLEDILTRLQREFY